MVNTVTPQVVRRLRTRVAQLLSRGEGVVIGTEGPKGGYVQNGLIGPIIARCDSLTNAQDIGEVLTRLPDVLDAAERLPQVEARVAVLAERLELAHKPCQCDPPGSGEEYCTGHCFLKADIARLRAALELVKQETRECAASPEAPSHGYLAAALVVHRIAELTLLRH